MLRAISALTIISLALVGCGGDDGEESSSDTTTEASSPETTADPGDTGDSGDVCAQFAELAEIDPSAQPTQADVDAVSAAAESAPPEIAAALEVVAGVGQLIADTDPATIGDPEVQAELEAATTGPEIIGAAETLAAYADEECGLEVPLFSSFG